MSSALRTMMVLVAALAIAGCRRKAEPAGADTAPPAPPAVETGVAVKIRPDVNDRLARYARIPLHVDLTALGESDRKILAELRKAADVMGEITSIQRWAGNPGMRETLSKLDGDDARAALDLFLIMDGPWDRQDEHLPFVDDTPHPKGGTFYPDDMTKEEFEAWVAANPDDAEAFRGFFTTIRRREGKLRAVPYSEEYRDMLRPAAASLRAAAALAGNASLRKYLEGRATAFETNDYYQSDLDWLDLEGSLEVVLGPYETYDDLLLGYKAAFEAFLCVDLPDVGARLAAYKGEVAYIESILPIPAEHRNPGRGAVVPIRVVDLVYATGKAGVMTIAFNLPNDERVRNAKGFKNVLMRNVMQAKYDAILVPIAERVLPPEMGMRVSFEAFLNFVLFHEIAHGLGPGKIRKDGRETDVRAELREFYSTIEEAKADILSLFVQKALVDKGVLPAAAIDRLLETYVAGIFRTARFGISEAHGQGVLVQVNFLLEKGAIRVGPDGRFAPVPERFHDAVRELASALLMLQALGDHDGAKAFLDKYGKNVPPGMPPLIESLGAGIPVDIDPIYPPVP
ncbi:MAG: peptidase [Myxococcota bacterium]|nr:peptidase [Myxococcota bacterium]